jgi:hypothetical protein
VHINKQADKAISMLAVRKERNRHAVAAGKLNQLISVLFFGAMKRF